MDKQTMLSRINECLSSICELQRFYRDHELTQYHMRNIARILELIAQQDMHRTSMWEIQQELKRIKQPSLQGLLFGSFMMVSAIAFWVSVLMGWLYG